MSKFSLHVWLHCKGSESAFSNENDLRLSLNIFLYVEKLLWTSCDVKGAYLKSVTLLLSSAGSFSPSVAPFPPRISFILHITENP
jgi:hypothetical protein